MTHDGDTQAGTATRPGQARDDQAQQAAYDSVDVQRLLPGETESSEAVLPGEDPTTRYRDDVDLWISVYAELLDFKRFMLDGASARAEAMTTSIARAEIETTDLRVARAEAERFTRRLAFWRGRLEELTAADAVAAPVVSDPPGRADRPQDRVYLKNGSSSRTR